MLNCTFRALASGVDIQRLCEPSGYTPGMQINRAAYCGPSIIQNAQTKQVSYLSRSLAAAYQTQELTGLKQGQAI